MVNQIIAYSFFVSKVCSKFDLKGPDGSLAHGPNYVISMVHHAFLTYGLGELDCSLHADNCGGNNNFLDDEIHIIICFKLLFLRIINMYICFCNRSKQKGICLGIFVLESFGWITQKHQLHASNTWSQKVKIQSHHKYLNDNVITIITSSTTHL